MRAALADEVRPVDLSGDVDYPLAGDAVSFICKDGQVFTLAEPSFRSLCAALKAVLNSSPRSSAISLT